MAISVTQAFKDALKGPVDRSQVKVEIYLGSWVDITSYVEEMSGALEEISSLSGGSSANTLNLTLINDDGRFSPKNTAGPYYGNLTPNKPIRVSSVYGSESVRMFTGYVSNWIPSAKARSCQVTAEDAARILRRKDITEETIFNDVAPTTGYYLTRVIERAAWLSGLRWDTCNTKTDTSGNVWAYSSHDGTSITVNKSAGATRATYTLAGQLVMTLDLVDLLLPCTPLKGKSLAVLDQLAKVVDGVVYFDAQGQLVFRSRMYRNDSTLASVETFTVSNLEDVTAQVNFEDSKWSQLCNKATVKSTPWAFKTDASGNVIEEEVPFKGDLFAKYYFAAGESYPTTGDADLYLELPNGVKLFKNGSYPTADNLILRSVDNADTTKQTTDIRFQLGYPQFEQTRVKVAFTNAGSTAQKIDQLTLKAKLMRPIQRCQSVQKNLDSIGLYDQRDKEVSNDFIPTATACKQLGAWLVLDGKDPKDYYTLPVMYGCPWLELGDRITVSETITNTIPTATDAIIRRITWRWTLAAFVFTLEACSPAASFTASSIPVTVTNVETANQDQNGTLSKTTPPQAIDSSQQLVGLNNIPSFNNLLTNVMKPVSFSPAMVRSTAVACDGAYIFVSDLSSARVFKVHPLTGAQMGAQSLDAGAWPQYMVAGNGLLFVADIWNNRIKVTSSSAFGAFTTKANFGTKSLSNIIVAGGKLYALGASGGTSYLYQWNSVTATQQDTADASYVLTNGGAYFAFDGQYLWISENVSSIARFDTQSNTLTPAAVTTSVTPQGLAHDGQNLWYASTDARIFRMSPSIDAGGKPTFKQETRIVTMGYAGPDLLFDGTYLWNNPGNYVYQISPSGAVVATFSTGGTATAGLAFDGQAVWTASQDANFCRIPRLVSGRQF